MTNHAKCGVPADDVFIEGGRRAILLLHRLGGTPGDFSDTALRLAAANLTVSCPQIYGHGGSRALLAATTAEDWVQSSLQSYEQLNARSDLVIVAGHAEGAVIAIETALRASRAPDALILLAPCAWPNGWSAPWHAPLVRRLGRRTAAMIRLDERPPYGIKDDALRTAALADLLADGRPSEDVFGRSGASWMDITALARAQDLKRIREPVLIIHPRSGDRSTLSQALDLQSRFAGRVDTLVLDDSFSFVMRDRQRSLVAERMLEFLGDIVAAAR
jgi:carboxylesterase